jgi:6-phosphofructokinase 2
MAPFTKLRCAAPLRHPGGGGINVARVIRRFGGDVTAIYPVGGATGALLRRLMEQESVPGRTITAIEETRQDFTVFEEATKQQFRFVPPGARLEEAEWRECLAAIGRADPRAEFIVASGSLPPGMPEDFFGRIADIARATGAKAVVDTSGPPLALALKAGCHLVKPNLREFLELTGVRSTDEAALIAAGRDLIGQGCVELIALTLGPRGALLIAGERVLRAEPLAVEIASVVGAGDSFLGAMVWSLARERDLEKALRYAAAAGAAALLSPGTELCLRDDVERLLPHVIVSSVAAG